MAKDYVLPKPDSESERIAGIQAYGDARTVEAQELVLRKYPWLAGKDYSKFATAPDESPKN